MTPLVNWHLSLQTIGRFQYWSVSALLAVLVGLSVVGSRPVPAR